MRLNPATGDLDRIILAADASDPGGGRDPTRCVAASRTTGDITVEEGSFSSAQDTTYDAVVDGYAGAVSGYSLEIRCAKQQERARSGRVTSPGAPRPPVLASGRPDLRWRLSANLAI